MPKDLVSAEGFMSQGWHPVAMSSHTGRSKRAKKFPKASKEPIPFMRALPSSPNHLPNKHLLIASPGGLGFTTLTLGG